MSNDRSNDKLEVPPNSAEDDKGIESTGKTRNRANVAKNSLVEQDLVTARDAARARVTGNEDATLEEIYNDRRAANRLASFQSRKRCKGNLDGLEKTVAQLEAAGEDQRKELDEQRERLQAVAMENEKLRQQLATQQSENVGAADPHAMPPKQQGDLHQHRTQQQSNSNETLVFGMLAKLNQLQSEQRAKRQAQEDRYTSEREALQARHSQQQQHLKMTQSEQLKQLENDQMQEQRQLAKKHDDEALQCTK
jgi:regulator of replication initiation timing